MGCIIKIGNQSVSEIDFLNYLNKIISVNKLFEENPDFSSQIYEALGFTGDIIQDNKSYYRGQIEQPTIDKNGNLVLYAKEDELYKRAGLKSKGVSMTDNLKSAIDYGNGQLEVARNLASESYDAEQELDRLSENGYYLIQIPKNISNEVVKEAGEVKVIGDKIIIPKEQYKIEQVIEGLEAQITPQQKATAQQAYSQYLDQIFPDSKVEEIDDSLYNSVLNQLEQENIIEKDCSGGKLKAKDGLRTKFTKGSQWEIYEIFEGKSHKQGGIDINIKNNQISFTNKNGNIKAKYGLVISKDN